jgi:large subunit ribosomal protein L24
MTEKIKIPVKIGDKVKIIAGNQKGLIGNVSLVNKKKQMVGIENLLPRITYKKNPQGGEARKVEIQQLVHLSNVMLWDSEANLSSKIGYKLIEGTKKRYFKKSGNFL